MTNSSDTQHNGDIGHAHAPLDPNIMSTRRTNGRMIDQVGSKRSRDPIPTCEKTRVDDGVTQASEGGYKALRRENGDLSNGQLNDYAESKVKRKTVTSQESSAVQSVSSNGDSRSSSRNSVSEKTSTTRSSRARVSNEELEQIAKGTGPEARKAARQLRNRKSAAESRRKKESEIEKLQAQVERLSYSLRQRDEKIAVQDRTIHNLIVRLQHAGQGMVMVPAMCQGYQKIPQHFVDPNNLLSPNDCAMLNGNGENAYTALNKQQYSVGASTSSSLCQAEVQHPESETAVNFQEKELVKWLVKGKNGKHIHPEQCGASEART